jgi:hypothetical protein
MWSSGEKLSEAFRELKVDYVPQTQNRDLLRFQQLKVLQEKI